MARVRVRRHVRGLGIHVIRRVSPRPRVSWRLDFQECTVPTNLNLGLGNVTQFPVAVPLRQCEDRQCETSAAGTRMPQAARRLLELPLWPFDALIT